MYCLQMWNFVWGDIPLPQHLPCLRMSVWSKTRTQRINKWRHRLYSTIGAWHFCQVRHVFLRSNKCNILTELFLTNDMSVNFVGIWRTLSVSASTCSRKVSRRVGSWVIYSVGLQFNNWAIFGTEIIVCRCLKIRFSCYKWAKKFRRG